MNDDVDFSSPVLMEHEGVWVVRDDLVAGGTKRRVLREYFRVFPAEEYVYPGTADGAAVIALGYAAAQLDVRVRIFIAAREKANDVIEEATEAGGNRLVWEFVPMGFYPNVKRAAERYCEARPKAHLLPCGLATDVARTGIAEVVRGIVERHGQFDVAFSVVSSGTLALGLQEGGLARRYVAVATGQKDPVHGAARLIRHYDVQPFTAKARRLPPYPTFPNYDGKAWAYARDYARTHPGDRVVLWNVAARRTDRRRACSTA